MDSGQVEGHEIQVAYRDKKVLLTAFVDLEGAFDSAAHLGILHKLYQLGITGPILAWFKDFLSERTFAVSVGGESSLPVVVNRGVPQGSVLSPLLFNILLHDAPSSPGTTLLIYADDISITCSATSLGAAEHLLQAAIDSFTTWATRWGLTVNAQKSACMCFTMKRVPALPSLQIRGVEVPFLCQHTFLGLRLDGPVLTWSGHME